VPSYIAFQETPLQAFWPLLVVPIAAVEIFSVFSFQQPGGADELWSIRSDFEPGDFGFDPLGLRPESPEEFKELCARDVPRAPSTVRVLRAACCVFLACCLRVAYRPRDVRTTALTLSLSRSLTL